MAGDVQPGRDRIGIFAIRPATADDADIIKMIVRAAMVNPLGLDWRRFVIMEHQEWPVGIAQLKPHRDGSLELASVVVVPEWQGGGAGSTLVRYMAARAGQPLFLMCLNRLVPFYESAGFAAIAPGAMPRDFRRSYRAFNAAMRLLRRPERLVIMKREG